MNALELIKQGILNGDMTKISKGYAMMTGEKLEPSQITDKHVEKLKDIFSDLQGRHPSKEETLNSDTPVPSSDELFPLLPGEVPPEETVVESTEELLEGEENENFSEQPYVEGDVLSANLNEAPVNNSKILIPGAIEPRGGLILNFNEQPLDEQSNNGLRQRQQCSRVAFSRAPRKNRFVDNKAIAREDTLLFDKKVRSKSSCEAHQFIKKRPPDVGVVVTCRECSRRYKINSRMAPGRIEGDDMNSYQCDSCILRKRG